jgi:maleylacetate reductase
VTPTRHRPAPQQSVFHGWPVGEALPLALGEARARRAVLVTNNSLALPGGLAGELERVLGERCVAVLSGIRAHSPREDVVRLARCLRDTGADAVVGLGGSSVCDAIKAARLCLANGAFDIGGMDALRASARPAALSPPALASIMVPTTLSAAEFTWFAGITDTRGPRKESFRHPLGAPDTVILDPAMARDTPARLWAGTGVRAVDHAVETWCSVNGTPLSDATALRALGLLVPALRHWHASPGDLDAVSQCQAGAWLAIQGVASLVDLGASHGIGHALGGTGGMAHGETSCVMLPHVLRYNAPVHAGRQAHLARAMGRPDAAPADIVHDLVRTLGLPGRLRDAGVDRQLLPRIAQEAWHDPWIATNPRPIDSAAGILELLEQAW